MCLKRVNWRQYSLSILLLIIVLASSSSQHTLIGSPQPFQRYSKAVGNDHDGFMPIVPPTQYKPAATPAAPSSASATDVTNREESVTTMMAAEAVEAERRTDTDAMTERKDESDTEAIRSIDHSIKELREMTMDFLAIIRQNGIQKRSTDQQRNFITDYLLSDQVINRVKKFTEKYIFQTGGSSALQSIVPAGGRLFFFKGMTNWLRYFYFK